MLPFRRETLTLTKSRLIHTTRSLICRDQLSVQETRLADVDAVNLLSADVLPSSVTINASAVFYVLQFASLYACCLSPLLLLLLVDVRLLALIGLLAITLLLLLIWRRLQLRTLKIISRSHTDYIDLEQADAEDAHCSIQQTLHPNLQRFKLPLPLVEDDRLFQIQLRLQRNKLKQQQTEEGENLVLTSEHAVEPANSFL